ncbi:SCO family protein [Ramlibacter albus]|nr:SCO family protein [Ramlibacter albus]
MRWLWVVLSCAVAGVHAQQVDALDARDAMRASQAAVGRTVGAHTLLDREGRPVPLAKYRGKPLLVSFIYTGCFQVCPTATRSLDESVAALQARFGPDAFAVASIGFNQPADSPQAMKAFAAQQRIARPGWDFLSAPAAGVARLAEDFGFRYAATPAGFDHVLQVTVVDADGRIVRQVYGDKGSTTELAEALGQLATGAPLASPGAIDALIEQVRILCTVYDPKTGTYRVDYGLALEVAGGVTFILFFLLYMLNEWRVRRRERRHGRGTATV